MLDLYADVAPAAPDPAFLARLTDDTDLALAISTEKARSEFIIAPILSEVRRMASRKISLLSGVDFPVDAAQATIILSRPQKSWQYRCMEAGAGYHKAKPVQRSILMTVCFTRLAAAFVAFSAFCACFIGARSAFCQTSAASVRPGMAKRWLFVWRDMSDAKEVDRMIARFPRARADGYNAVAFSANVAPEKAAELKEAARENGLELVVMVMGGSRDHNYAEGLLANALFRAHGTAATHQPDKATQVVNGDFEESKENHAARWGFQDDEGVTTFIDHAVFHSGGASLRMENFTKNEAAHARIEQPIKLIPHRQYHVSFWLKTENMVPANPELKILTPDTKSFICFQTPRVTKTQDWTHYDLAFNSLDNTSALLYLGTWNGKSGKMWWDDVKIEEVALVNVLRRPGCPVTVQSETGTLYAEGRDFAPVIDPALQPYIAYHTPPDIRLLPQTRIKEGELLRVSFYHPELVYEDRLTYCLSEPKIFADWKAEVIKVNDLLHPSAFLMQHDELRVINQCALCQSKHETPGELLAENVRKAAGIIRAVRPDAAIWVWSDMFDPFHNAVDNFYAVNGTLKGSWKGLDKEVGIVNWNGGAMGKNCAFFADLGLKQILSGYYDSDANGTAITQWQQNTKTVPGIVGAMYTTWENNYDAMDMWAEKAWGAPPAKAK